MSFLVLTIKSSHLYLLGRQPVLSHILDLEKQKKKQFRELIYSWQTANHTHRSMAIKITFRATELDISSVKYNLLDFARILRIIIHNCYIKVN